MARMRKGLPVNGWLILDKPQGLNSTKAVSRVKHLFNAQKAGHAGTLDPLATGVLPIALGEATKTVPFVMDGSKAYRFTIVWGAETDTDDSDGTVTETSDKRPSRAEIEDVLPRFTGTISQTPPRYSALKVDGARAYDLARENEEFELQPRDVTHRPPKPGRDSRSGSRRARSGMRQGDLCPGAGARHRARAWRARPCRRASPDQGRPLR